ncbi:hypothetical protein [Nostoc parmelioides]|uniref:Uncharacterized protein n=1 Tax=Nostoc parmelioides FACHB-3921 TaxID=2692909 RepID=A0ABR8BJ74_9NOSO|nr:hypothetical protein [Nostoc parmelioides]MBD2253177.1 hypothetical protein [Nostoc parmelioides FACHB-3921]
MFLKPFSGLMVIASLSLSGIAIIYSGQQAIAETKNNNFYLQVGADQRGFPIALDLASINGTNFTLVQQHGEGIAKRRLHAACSQGRLFTKKFSLYAANGKLTSEDKTEQEIFPKPKTADAASMEIVCRVANNRQKN